MKGTRKEIENALIGEYDRWQQIEEILRNVNKNVDYIVKESGQLAFA